MWGMLYTTNKIWGPGWFIVFVIVSGLKIRALSQRGLLQRGALVEPHFLTLFLVPFWCPQLFAATGPWLMWLLWYMTTMLGVNLLLC